MNDIPKLGKPIKVRIQSTVFPHHVNGRSDWREVVGKLFAEKAIGALVDVVSGLLSKKSKKTKSIRKKPAKTARSGKRKK